MLEHGEPEARLFLPQLEKTKATSWRCPCGCPSINFSVEDLPVPSSGVNPIADFIFGFEDDLSGIFIRQQNGILAELEVYGLSGDAPKVLPLPESLRPLSVEKSKS